MLPLACLLSLVAVLPSPRHAGLTYNLARASGRYASRTVGAGGCCPPGCTLRTCIARSRACDVWKQAVERSCSSTVGCAPPASPPAALPWQVWCEVFLVDNGAPLSLDHYHGIYIGLEKLKIVRGVACHLDVFGMFW